MAINYIADTNGTAVSVEEFSDLQTVIESQPDVTMVYLAKDIDLTAKIAFNTTRESITIDGADPETGQIHTLTETLTGTGNRFGLYDAPAGNMIITLKNVILLGKNYYGMPYIGSGTAFEGVTVVYDNVTYTGPQIAYHWDGLVRLIDCHVTSDRPSGADAAQEIGEVKYVEIGGETVLDHRNGAYTVFQYRRNDASLTILEGAQVTIYTNQYVVDANASSSPVPLVIQDNASLSVEAAAGITGGTGDRISSLTVGAGAELRFIQPEGTRRTNPCIMFDTTFQVASSARVYMQDKESNSTSALIRFYENTSSMTIDDPASFVLYNYNGSIFQLPTATATALNFSTTAQQLNSWATAKSFDIAGSIDDLPDHSWRSSDGRAVNITAQYTRTGTAIVGTEFTPEEIDQLDDLSLLQYQNQQVLSMGYLTLDLDPVTNDGEPISGTTTGDASIVVRYTGLAADLTGTADQTGWFSITTPDVIPEGTDVNVYSLKTFLHDTVLSTSVLPGELTLLNAPTRIAFQALVSSLYSGIYERDETEWSITVSDTRVRSLPWYLYATADSDLTSSTGQTLPGALVFIDEESEVHPFTQEPLLIHTGEGNQGTPLVTEISWDADKGVLQRDVGVLKFINVEYSASIGWELTATKKE